MMWQEIVIQMMLSELGDINDVQVQVQVQFIWFHLITFYNKNR